MEFFLDKDKADGASFMFLVLIHLNLYFCLFYDPNSITTATHIEKFVSLWIRIQEVHLVQGVKDSITWKWTPDGNYSTRSAYRIQFRGSFAKFPRDHIWKAHAENKCKVFTRILIHEKLLTADNLQKRG
jgi:hypothetical protein